MMRFAFVLIAALTFAGCEKSDPTACQAGFGDLYVGSTDTEEAPDSKREKGAAEVVLDTKDKYDKVMAHQSEFEKCLETRCNAKDSCAKEDKKCLETYETCVSKQTDLAINKYWREVRSKFDGILGMDWLPFIAALLLAWWLAHKFPFDKWGEKSWETKKWLVFTILWPLLPILVIILIVNSSYVGTVGLVIYTGAMVTLVGLQWKTEKRLKLDQFELESEPSPEPEADPDPPLPPHQAKLCPSCNAPIADGVQSCGECGASVAEVAKCCPSCKSPIADGVQSCGECGASVS